MAYESDICLVSNAVTDDLEFIAEDDLYKYTYATERARIQIYHGPTRSQQDSRA